MRQFEDLKKRTWEFEITVGCINAVHELLGIDMTDLGEEGLLRNIAMDPVKLVDMFWELLKDQVHEKGYKNVEGEPLTPMDFGKGFNGKSIEAATVAFVDALIDFFPNEAKRETARKIFAKTNNLVTKGLEMINQKVGLMDEEAILKEAFKET